MLAGAFEFEFEAATGKKILLRPGHALVFPWRFAHRWKCLRSGPMIGISLELLPSTESIRRDGWLIEDMAVISSPTLASQAANFVRSAGVPIHRALRSKAIACRLFLLLDEILEHLFPKHGFSKADANDQASEMRGRDAVGRILEHLRQNLKASVNLTQIAREAGWSGRHLRRLFLKHMGESLHHRLLKMRLDEARRLLLDTRRKMLIKEIAYHC